MSDLYLDACPDYFRVQRQDLRHYERLWSVLLKRLGRPSGRLLIDWGSGPGFLCAQAARMGWHTAGIEPSVTAREHAWSLGVRCYETAQAYLAHNYGVRADAIVSTETLEHVEDVDVELKQMRLLLKEGGLLAISVPNDYNPLQRLFWPRKKPWLTPLHLRYFNKNTLREAVERAGFAVEWEGASFPVEILLKVPFLPRKVAWKLSRLWASPPALWRARIGRHCLLVARRV